MKIVIVIPVYKNPSPEELVSLKRCCEILGKYDHAIVCPNSFDLASFRELWKSYGLEFKAERFDDSFFNDIFGYNKLCLTPGLYERFSEFDYMLIYQPDAYIFRDELEYWCNKGYDYIGAPIIDKEWNSEMLLRVGNGGFCLRKIDTFLRYFHSRNNVYSVRYIWKSLKIKEKTIRHFIAFIFTVAGWRNRPKSVALRWWKENRNEDDFWSKELNNSKYSLNIAPLNEALHFSFERFPSKMYKMTNALPMGCHAWHRHEKDSFWKKHIYF